ncbi:RIIA lysis inhibitor [Dinoroseobacter phage DFL12phi1]|uniref:RIIA-like protein n=1 Tax=Dinoroseobacter phage DFL12phi1 TaxID=1477404 RepID=A0A023NHT3_9CAUD|nr:RIIA lysis inhibitor [Dinoroseobacter phage DFL12phi1]AHX01004.1 RIIA-like protein [Dinoroseobacter phage DFL12phi1]
MQVLNGGDFEQKNVLIGGGETEAFGVTNDPVLMGMLSTGLYQKPMRTMIQETMFNAWDAHRMGNCQDRPIDIYINDTSGLIIRDYGPGIHKKEIHPIYCIYGNSTKRDNDELTGGFGLGSKSPYAYTDSFTVTSHHDGFKGMYVMNRVSEKNNGGPGRSIIFEDVPTEESGLLVTIPLKSESDMERAYEYIKELMYLSGIKANIHFKDEEVETIEADSVAPGQWIVDDENGRGDLYAVYGGVRYELIEDEAYSSEFRFVKKMARLLGTMYIGFKASTLTPLPSREGLNLNEKTVETIKNQLEIMEENFRLMLTPATRVMLNESFKSLKESGVEPKFLIEAWVRVGDRKNLSQVTDVNHPVLSAGQEQCPEGMNQSMWNSICELCYRKTDDIERMLGSEKMDQMKYIIWAKNFPDFKHYRNYIMHRGSPKHELHTPTQIETPKSMQELIEAKKICDDATGLDNDIRVEQSDTWYVVENRRRAGKLSGLNQRQKNVIEQLGGQKALSMPNRQYPDRLWFKKDGKEYTSINLTKTVILAKTLSALKDTSFNYQSMFTANYPTVGNYHNFHRSSFGDHYYRSYDRPVAAIIVHQKKGAYDKALKALEDAGYIVHEADEPVAPVRKAPGYVAQPRATATYPLYSPAENDWADWDNAVENPTCYITLTEHKIRHGYRSDLPDKQLMAWVYQNTPRFVVIHNKSRVTKKFEKIPTYEQKLHQLVVKILENEQKVETMRLHYLLQNESGLPEKLLALPEIQKFFGVPYLRTKQKETFFQNMKLLHVAKNCRYTDSNTRHLITESLSPYVESDTVSLVRKRMENLELFNDYRIASHVNRMKPGEIKVFSEKLMRFLRTV